MSKQRRANEADAALASAGAPEFALSGEVKKGRKKKEKRSWKTIPCRLCRAAASEMHVSSTRGICLQCDGVRFDQEQRKKRIALFRNTPMADQEALAKVRDAAQIEKESKFVAPKDDPFKAYDPGVVRHSVCKTCKDVYRLVLQPDAAGKLRLSTYTRQSYDLCHACLSAAASLVEFQKRKKKVVEVLAASGKQPGDPF